MTYTDILAASARLTDHQRLMLIDAIADQCSDDLDFGIDLSVAFEVCEEHLNPSFAPIRPGPCGHAGEWQEYRARRDSRLTRALAVKDAFGVAA